jgi:hypothetical protein
MMYTELTVINGKIFQFLYILSRNISKHLHRVFLVSVLVSVLDFKRLTGYNRSTYPLHSHQNQRISENRLVSENDAGEKGIVDGYVRAAKRPFFLAF